MNFEAFDFINFFFPSSHNEDAPISSGKEKGFDSRKARVSCLGDSKLGFFGVLEYSGAFLLFQSQSNDSKLTPRITDVSPKPDDLNKRKISPCSSNQKLDEQPSSSAQPSVNISALPPATGSGDNNPPSPTMGCSGVQTQTPESNNDKDLNVKDLQNQLESLKSEISRLQTAQVTLEKHLNSSMLRPYIYDFQKSSAGKFSDHSWLNRFHGNQVETLT